MATSSDAGPLIWLEKLDLLHLLKKLYSRIVISESVYKEAVICGIEKGFEDAQVIEKAIGEGWIKVHKAGKEFTDKVESVERRLGIELGEGEREAIAPALEKGISTLLTNDEDAYQVGRILELEAKGILYILLRSVKDGYLNKKPAKESLRQMLEEGLWLSPTLIHNFHETLDKL